jgi:hypothetical protein
MEPLREEYEEALWLLLRAAKRFRTRIGLFRDANIGGEIWDAVNAGSRVMTALEYTEQMNDFLIHELWQLGAVRREQLHAHDSKLNKELWTLFAVTPMSWVVDVSDRENSRVKHVTVAYPRNSELTTEQITGKVMTALDRTVLNEPDGIIYASNLKFYLEEEGLYGVALQDIRDEKFDWLLAGVIAKGRLLIHTRKEAGLPRREPKAKKKTKVE